MLFPTPYPSPTSCALDALDRLWVAHPHSHALCCYETAYHGALAVLLELPRGCAGGCLPVGLVFGGAGLKELLVSTEEGGVLAVSTGGLATGCPGSALPVVLQER